MIENKKYLVTGVGSAVFFLAVGQPMLLLFSLFPVVLSFEGWFQKVNLKIKLPLLSKMIIFMFFIGFLTEFFAIWNNANLSPEQIVEGNKLFSPEPFLNVVLSWGYYLPLAVVWYFLLKKYHYKTKDVFISMGIFGIVFEGQGLIFMSFNPLIWAYAFAIHGAYLAILHLMIKKDPFFNAQKRKTLTPFRKYIYGFFFSISIAIPFAIWSILIEQLNS